MINRISILSVFIATYVSVAQGTPTVGLDAWLAKNAIHISGPGHPLTDAEVRLLDRQLQGKRVVFLGESAHWVHQKYDFRLRFLEYLASRGFRHIGMEMGLSDGARIDRYMISGDARDLDRVALYGYNSPVIRHRPPVYDCSFGSTTHPDFAKLFREEEIRFYSKLHSIGQNSATRGEPLRHFGFDIDTVPGGAYEDIEALLEDGPHSREVERLRRQIAPVVNETIDEEVKRLNQVLERIERRKASLWKKLGRKRFAELRLSLMTLIESLKFEAVQSARPCNEKELEAWTGRLMKAMAEREEMMFEIVKAKLDELGPKAKIVLMGHTFHLSKDAKSLWFTDTSVPDVYAPTMWPSIGEYLMKVLKVPTYSIWMVQNRGYQSDLDCPEIECPIDVGPDSLGEKLASIGPTYSLALSPMLPKKIHAYFDRRLNFAVNSGRSSGRIGRNADLIFFVDQVTGLRAGPEVE